MKTVRPLDEKLVDMELNVRSEYDFDIVLILNSFMYEAFNESARLLSSIMGYTLGTKKDGTLITGLPKSQLSNVINKIESKGLSVGVIDIFEKSEKKNKRALTYQTQNKESQAELSQVNHSSITKSSLYVVNPQDLSIRLTAVVLIERAIVKIKNNLREELANHLLRENVKKLDASFESTRVSSHALGGDKQKYVISDDAAFVMWVKENYPSEIVETVNPIFRNIFTEELRAVGNKAIFAKTGELIDFVEVRQQKSFLITRIHSEGVEKIENALADGRLESMMKNVFPGWIKKFFVRDFLNSKLD